MSLHFTRISWWALAEAATSFSLTTRRISRTIPSLPQTLSPRLLCHCSHPASRTAPFLSTLTLCRLLFPHPRAGRLRRFALFPWLKRQAMVIVARSLTQSQLAYARDMFEAFERHEATSGGATTEQGASSPSSNQPQTSVQQQTDGAGAKITGGWCG